MNDTPDLQIRKRIMIGIVYTTTRILPDSGRRYRYDTPEFEFGNTSCDVMYCACGDFNSRKSSARKMILSKNRTVQLIST